MSKQSDLNRHNELDPCQVLPFRVRVDLGAMAIKLQHYWNLTIRLFSVISRTHIGWGSYPSIEVQSVYSTAPADWAMNSSIWSNIRYKQVLPLWVSVDQGVIIGRCHTQEIHCGWGSWLSAEVQREYSTVPDDWLGWPCVAFCTWLRIWESAYCTKKVFPFFKI